MPITAQLSTEKGRKRKGARRELILRTQGHATGHALDNVAVLNLSTSGLLIETQVRLSVGDELAISLPESGMSHARVVWAGGNLFGCAFDKPLSDHVVSAALLRSEPARGALPNSDVYERALSPRLSGSEIRKLRLSRGLSLVDFAQRMQVSRPTVWAWESGKSVPRASKLLRLSQVLGMTVGEGNPGSAGEALLDSDMGTPKMADTLASAILESKNRVARIAGTTPNHIKVIIEL